MSSMLGWLIPVVAVFAIAGVGLLISIMFRVVVSTNEVHVVQTRSKTVSYGTNQEAGNVYFKWPASLPRIGVSVIVLPVDNFNVSLKDYEAYDKDRVPFVVDVTAFFRIKNTGIAAQRISSVAELHNQLKLIAQGAVRKVLASANIDTIMLERAQFGHSFTEDVREQLEEWGVEPVKSMELMDIRDGHDSKVISNIMAKKTSHIDMESRVEVAKNHQAAQMAEINAQREVDVRKQEALQLVGERTAEKQRVVGIADQKSRQEVLTEEKVTRERDMEVKRVEMVKLAEITKAQQIVAAEQDRDTKVLIAEGDLEAKRREAQGIMVEGEAKAEAEKLMQLAPVQAQIVLAKEIGANTSYQQYLTTIKALEAQVQIGVKQAEALTKAEVKVIANTGKPVEGVASVMDLFSSNGGTQMASALEAMAQTPLGKAFLDKFGVSAPSKPTATLEG